MMAEELVLQPSFEAVHVLRVEGTPRQIDVGRAVVETTRLEATRVREVLQGARSELKRDRHFRRQGAPVVARLALDRLTRHVAAQVQGLVVEAKALCLEGLAQTAGERRP